MIRVIKLNCISLVSVKSNKQIGEKKECRKMESNCGGREERPAMVLTVTEDTPADMLAGSMELLVQLPRDHNVQTQRVTVQRSTPMMDLLVQVATAHKLVASSYTLQAIGERGMVLPHQPNTPIGALDALQVKLLPKQGTFLSRKTRQANQPFETTFRLQVHLPRNQLYVSRVSPKMNLGDILEEVCREKNLDMKKYELRHPANLEEILDLSLSLQDYHLQEVTLYAKQGRIISAALSSQDIMALQKQEDRRRQQAKQSVFGFMFKKSKENSLSTDSLGERSVSPARSDETGRSSSPMAPPPRPLRKRRQAPKPPVSTTSVIEETSDSAKDKMVISHSRNSSDSSGYHEASVLSDHPESAGRMPETLPRRGKTLDTPRNLAQTSHASKSLGNLALASGGLSHGISTTSLSSTGQRKKRAAPPPPIAKLPSAISSQALECIVDSEESLTSDMELSKPSSDIATSSKANSDIAVHYKANSDIGITTLSKLISNSKSLSESEENTRIREKEAVAAEKISETDRKIRETETSSKEDASKPVLNHEPVVTSANKPVVANAKVVKRVAEYCPTPKPRKLVKSNTVEPVLSGIPKRKAPSPLSEDQRLSQANSPELVTFEQSVANSIKSLDDVLNNSLLTDTELTLENENNNQDNNFENNSPKPVNLPQDTEFPKQENKHPEIKKIEKLDKKEKKEQTEENQNVPNSENLENEKLNQNVNSYESRDNEQTENNWETPAIKSSNEIDNKKRSCKIISTIPKCDHLDCIDSDDLEISNQYSNNDTVNKSENDNSQLIEKIESEKYAVDLEDNKKTWKSPDNEHEIHKRTKIFRSQSELSNFEINTPERIGRHLTSHAEDFLCAFNTNLSANISNLSSPPSSSSTTITNNFDKTENFSTQHNKEELELRHSDKDFNCQRILEKLKEDVEQVKQLTHNTDSPARLSETDILLQKVSDTLSSALPPTPPPTPLESLEVSRIVDLEISKKEPKKQKTIVESQKSTCPSEEKQSSSKDHISEKSIIGTSSPDVTVNSQQDTSDYVSASGEDLSLPDWEYQLPAPPTAFRDVETSSIVISESDCPQKQEIIPPPISTDQTDSTLNFPQNQKFKSIEKSPENLKTEIPSKMENKTRQISPEAYKSELNLELKREMISELESKIEIRSQQPQAKHEIEDVSTPNIAPVDNTLSNFTFTTYARQKSLNIFDEIEEQSVPLVKTSNEKSRATLTLQRNEESKDRMAHKPIDVTTKVFISRTQSIERVTTPLDSELRRPEYKTNQQGNLNRRQSLKSEIDKPVTVYRSKSYITLTSNEKYKGHSNEEENEKITLEEESEKTTTSSNIQKATSVTNLNQDMTRSNEKFSQWRDNILKRQEEPTKEKQLQSLQVLKSILPQLKNAQQAEENVRKNAIEKQPTTDKKSETVPEESSRAEPKITTTTNDVQMRSELKNRKVNPEKRYTYSGPPAVSLGSWSERPCVNVQIKMDTDYKLGVNNTSGSKTIVNLNGSRNERDPINTQEITSRTLPKNTINGFKEKETKSESNDFSKKAITQTTITAFKKPTIINKMNYTDSTEVKPIVTSVELKKLDKSENHEIETKSIKFEELSKTFGQEVRLRTKPKSSISQNRHSEYFGRNSEIVNNIVNAGNNNNNNNNKQNGYQEANNHVTTFNGTQNIPIKKYTSVVGINSQSNNNFRFQNGQLSKNNNVTSMRINGPMPIVKGFNVLPSQISTVTVKQNESSVVDSSKNDARIPKPPTMPIITGVTLKSANARPKSMPVNIDPRDQLLESIRNFGGRDKLRSAAGRY
ncbi:myb-like protein P isoform X2 [Leptopilina heterotoma]|uniref:myb-like protein P isoform X2 n=1 Tax=Leptopilina heterotoma TaxID=63436 RepID=UPI001CA8DF4A|nr:myb-like protein P isoform X2 [Leptopilina heterotoma]